VVIPSESEKPITKFSFFRFEYARGANTAGIDTRYQGRAAIRPTMNSQTA